MSKRIKLKEYFIENKVLDAPLWLFVGPEERLTDFINKIATKKGWENENDPDLLGGFYKLKSKYKKYCPDRAHVRFVWLKQFKNTVFDLGVLIHEVQHYVNNVCVDKGIKHTRGDEETSAYLMEYTMKSCLEVLRYK